MSRIIDIMKKDRKLSTSISQPILVGLSSNFKTMLMTSVINGEKIIFDVNSPLN